MKNYFTWFLVIIIAILLLYIFLTPKPANPTIEKEKEFVKLKEHHIEALAKVEEHFTKKLKEDSLKSKIAETAYIRENKALRKELSIRKSRVIEKLVADTAMAAYSDFQDSIINHMDARIDTLTKEKEHQWNDFNKILSVEQEKFNDSQAINKSLNSQIDEFNKQNKKLRRQNTWLKVGIFGALIGGAYISASR